MPVQVSYAIGVAQPLSVFVDTYGTGKIPDKEILAKILDKFDFRPGMLMTKSFHLPMYQPLVSLLKFLCRHDCAQSGPFQATLPEDGCLWTLWSRGARVYMGKGHQALSTMLVMTVQQLQFLFSCPPLLEYWTHVIVPHSFGVLT